MRRYAYAYALQIHYMSINAAELSYRLKKVSFYTANSQHQCTQRKANLQNMYNKWSK